MVGSVNDVVLLVLEVPMSVSASDATATIQVTSLREFFHDSVQHALQRQHVALEAQTEHYLVDVLTRFARSDEFFDAEDHGRRGQRPLAALLADALSAQAPEQRRALMQRLGDVSLFMAGFLAQSFARKLVDIDYCIAMGGRAYAFFPSLQLGQSSEEQLTNDRADSTPALAAVAGQGRRP